MSTNTFQKFLQSKSSVSINQQNYCEALFEHIDQVIAETISESPINTMDLIKLAFSLSFRSSLLKISVIESVISNSLPLIDLLKTVFFHYPKITYQDADKTNYSICFKSYTTFNIRFLILNELGYYKNDLIEAESPLILNRPPLEEIAPSNLVLYFLAYSGGSSEILDLKVSILFSLFDTSSYGFIESDSKSYLLLLRNLIYCFIFCADSLLNYYFIKQSCEIDNLPIVSILSRIRIQDDKSGLKDVCEYKKVLFFMTDTQNMKDFVNYISHNYVFEGNSSKNKLNLREFKLNLKNANYAILSPSVVRNTLARYVTKGKVKEFNLYKEELKELIRFHDERNKEECIEPEFVSKYKKTNNFMDGSAFTKQVSEKLLKYESLLVEENNFRFYRGIFAYKLNSLSRVANQKAKSMKSMISVFLRSKSFGNSSSDLLVGKKPPADECNNQVQSSSRRKRKVKIVLTQKLEDHSPIKDNESRKSIADLNCRILSIINQKVQRKSLKSASNNYKVLSVSSPNISIPVIKNERIHEDEIVVDAIAQDIYNTSVSD